MALIKNRNARCLATREFQDLGDLEQQAASIVEAARVEAALIIKTATERAEAAVAEATPRGFAEGREQGLSEGHEQGCRVGREETIGRYTAELATLAESWITTLEAFEADRREMLQRAREDIVELAVAIGAKITRRVVEADPAVVQDHVAEAISLVTAPSGLNLSINPADRELVQAVLPALCDRLGQGEHVELRDDADVERGGCVLSTGHGVIDATLQKQLERIAETLLPGRGRKK